ncbi:MAG: 2,3-bisphosphoglycerate-dependent phosphoglycerate mutase [Gammaproteobacteria bacterium WSBS_2016_MAG_OTU1]
MPQPALALVRHGQSAWNLQNLFTGWQNPPLTEKGREEAKAAADSFIADGITFDVLYTSYLRRAIETLWIIQERMQLMWLPVATDWRLNERHYGDLQGKNKNDILSEYGEEQLHLWRRSYDTAPPSGNSADNPDHRYANISIPCGESLATTKIRVIKCYEQCILPQLQQQKRVLIVAHGNSLRALIMHIEQIPPANIMEKEIHTGGTIIYPCDNNGLPIPPHSEHQSS